jgi:type I restriction enzyme S subunit
LRQGWQTKTLGDICSIARGGSPRPIQKFLTKRPDGINWIKIGDATASSKYIYKTEEKIISEGVKRSRLVKDGDFLLSNSMSFGRPYIVRTTGCVHDGWLILSDKSGLFDQDYLYYFLGSAAAYKQFDNLAAGSTVRNLNTELVKRVTLPLPPIPQQQRIVAILDEAFAGLATATANAEKNLKNARELFDTHLKHVFRSQQEGWIGKKLGEVCRLITDGKHGDCANEDDSGYYFLSARDVKDSTLSYERARQITKADFEETHRRTNLEPGDVLVTNAGTIGRIAIAPNDERTRRTTFQKSVAVLKVVRGLVDSSFCAYSLATSLIDLQSLSAGTAQKNLLLRDLRSFPFWIPSLSKQKAIVEELDEFSNATHRSEKFYHGKIGLLENLKQSILQKAFSGELTSPPSRAIKEAAE